MCKINVPKIRFIYCAYTHTHKYIYASTQTYILIKFPIQILDSYMFKYFQGSIHVQSNVKKIAAM